MNFFQSEMFANASGAFFLGVLIIGAIISSLFNEKTRKDIYSATRVDKIVIIFIAVFLVGLFGFASFEFGMNIADEKLLAGVSPEQRKEGEKIEAGIIIVFEKSGPKIKLKSGTTVPTK